MLQLRGHVCSNVPWRNSLTPTSFQTHKYCMAHCETGWAQPQLSWAGSCCRSLVFIYESVWDGLTSRLTFYFSVQTGDDRSGRSAENKNSLCLSCDATHWHVMFGLGFVFCHTCPIIRQERTFSQ